MKCMFRQNNKIIPFLVSLPAVSFNLSLFPPSTFSACYPWFYFSSLAQTHRRISASSSLCFACASPFSISISTLPYLRTHPDKRAIFSPFGRMSDHSSATSLGTPKGPIEIAETIAGQLLSTKKKMTLLNAISEARGLQPGAEGYNAVIKGLTEMAADYAEQNRADALKEMGEMAGLVDSKGASPAASRALQAYQDAKGDPTETQVVLMSQWLSEVRAQSSSAWTPATQLSALQQQLAAEQLALVRLQAAQIEQQNKKDATISEPPDAPELFRDICDKILENSKKTGDQCLRIIAEFEDTAPYHQFLTDIPCFVRLSAIRALSADERSKSDIEWLQDIVTTLRHLPAVRPGSAGGEKKKIEATNHRYSQVLFARFYLRSLGKQPHTKEEADAFRTLHSTKIKKAVLPDTPCARDIIHNVTSLAKIDVPSFDTKK